LVWDGGLPGAGNSTSTQSAAEADAATHPGREAGVDATSEADATQSGGTTNDPDGASAARADSAAAGSDHAGDSGADVVSDGAADGPPPEVCTSGVYAQGLPGPTMDPGDTCPSCHSTFQIAGTVYATANDPTSCNGVPGDNLSVVITDADGNVQTLIVNDAGNFYSTQKVTFPFHAKVVSPTAERDMMAAQLMGDCNYCHSPQGMNGAPGRIMSP
jgi:hypothetical protein